MLARHRATPFFRGSRGRLPLLAVTIVALVLGPIDATARARGDELICVTVGSKRYVGDPLFVSQSQILLLLRDGRLRELPGTSTAQVERISDRFQSYSSIELRGRLTREFGSNFEITATRHYVVVHPQGQSALWPARFEELYAHFVHYFSVRGLQLDEPRVPLVAIVLHDRGEFQDYARSRDEAIDASVVGYYSSATNRIALYDVSNGSNSPQGWAENGATIYHEAAHQAAFNTGVHSRFTSSPRWATEGLGTLFEAPAVWGGQRLATDDGRLNRRMLEAFRRDVADLPDRLGLYDLLAGDESFDRHPEGAYARAWALSYFLAETRPRDYAAYLAYTADKPDFRRVTAAERLHDWQAYFPDDLETLEAQLLKFVQGL